MFDIEAHINCASFTPAAANAICAGCPNSDVCYSEGEIELAVHVVHPARTSRRRIIGVLTLRHTRSIAINLIPKE